MTKLYLYFILGAGAFFALVYFIQSQRDIGGSTERVNQEKENAVFEVKARKGDVDYTTCDRANGLYDFTKGTCKLPSIE